MPLRQRQAVQQIETPCLYLVPPLPLHRSFIYIIQCIRSYRFFDPDSHNDLTWRHKISPSKILLTTQQSREKLSIPIRICFHLRINSYKKPGIFRSKNIISPIRYSTFNNQMIVCCLISKCVINITLMSFEHIKLLFRRTQLHATPCRPCQAVISERNRFPNISHQLSELFYGSSIRMNRYLPSVFFTSYRQIFS